jgi:uncharacterized membrane protein
MTDGELKTPAQTPPPVQPSTSRGVKIALAVSVALNLAIVGLVFGAWLGDGPRQGLPRDLSFGPFSEAFTDADRRALRKALSDRAGEFRASREASRAELEALLVALRADPFDPDALRRAMIAVETRNADRLQMGRSLIETRLVEMSTEDRQAFADRLEKRLRRGGKN